MRPFLHRPDPEREHDREWRRDAYALRGEQDRPIRLNEGTPYEEPLTVEVALLWAEHLAEEAL